jgi:transposase
LETRCCNAGASPNEPIEAVKNFTKRAKRAAFSFTNFASYRTRLLLHAGKLSWSQLATVRPR